MVHRFWLASAAFAAIGCHPEAAPGPDMSEPPPATSITKDPPPSVAQSSTRAESPPAPPPTDSALPRLSPLPPPFVTTEIAPTQGELIAQLKVHVERAKAKRLIPVAEFYADWCPPCREFHKALSQPPLADAIRGTYLVRLNMDDWHDHLKNTGFDVRSIPRFYLLGDDGRSSGKMLDGDKWGRATPENMAAAIDKLFGR